VPYRPGVGDRHRPGPPHVHGAERNGRPLPSTTFWKATLLGTVPAAALGAATAAWDEAQVRLREDFDSLFSHVRTIYRRSSAHIISGIKSIAKEHGGAEAFIANALRPAAAVFDDIRAARHSGSAHSDAIAASLTYLGWLKGGDWIPPAMLWWLERGDDAAELASFLAALDRLAYGLRILGIGTKRRVGRLGSVVQAIRQGQDLKGPASPLRLAREEQGTIHYNLRDLHARSAPMAKLVLLRLNDQIAGKPQNLALEDLTVEHLLPRKPGANSRWREWFPDPAERGRCTDPRQSGADDQGAERQGRQSRLRAQAGGAVQDLRRAAVPINEDMRRRRSGWPRRSRSARPTSCAASTSSGRSAPHRRAEAA
jgi:hypothetical protein